MATVKTRIQLKHDTEANWDVLSNFKPLEGELIIYDPDEDHPYPRFKVGDGQTDLKDLNFSLDYDNLSVSLDVDYATGLKIATLIANNKKTYLHVPSATVDDYGVLKVGKVHTNVVTTNVATTPSKYYAVELDSSGKGIVNVPWENTAPFIASTEAPKDTRVLWIDTRENGGLKYYNGANWVVVPVCFS